MIDFSTEPPLTFPRAAKLLQLQRDGRPPHVSTLWRWYGRGVLRHGTRHRLEASQVGGRLCTSRAAVDRFLAALNGEAAAAPAPAGPAARDRAIAAAERALDDAGVR